MAFVIIDTFTFRSEGYTRDGIRIPDPNGYFTVVETVSYDSVTDKFKVDQISTYDNGTKNGKFPMIGSVLVYERGKVENQEISSICSGTSKISFQATLNNPFVKRVITADSASCGYVAPAPPPVCDLVLSATTTQPTFGNNDAVVTANLSTVNTGLATVSILYANSLAVIASININLANSKTVDFTGIASGEYIVRATLFQFSCQSSYGITVPTAIDPPPPVCDLIVTGSSTGVTFQGLLDGTITAVLNTVNNGTAIITLAKNGIIVTSYSIDLSVTNEHTFTGLEDGEYTIIGSLIEYQCQNSTTETVAQAPTLVCDLTLSTTSTSLSGLNTKDGSVTANYSTENESYIILRLFKDGLLINIVYVLPTSNEYIFTGLDYGNYQVKASLTLFLCEKESSVVVAPMSFNEKYYFEYCESRFENRPIKVSLKKKNYSGVSTKIANAQKVVTEIDWKSESEYKFEPILGSSCDINLISMENFEYADLFITEEQDTLVEVFLDEELFWTGYLTGDRATEAFKYPPYEISLSALDGIKLLKDQDFDLSDRYISFLEAIKFILDKTNLSLPFKTMCDIEDKTLNVDYKLLSGFETNVYGNSVVVNDGTGVINGVLFDITGGTFAIPDLPSGIYEKKYYLIASSTSVYLSPTFDIANYAVLLIATVVQTTLALTAKRTRLTNGDVLNDHLFNTNVFQKSETDFTDCTEALEFICRQFTCQVKQSDGYWVIENIGSKARLNLTEFIYDKDLNIISSGVVNLVKDIDCSQDINNVLSGANISLITGDKKATVHWKLGYPKPIFGNWNFEQWFIKNGAEIPAQWQVTEPYGWFNKGAKFDRIYDPVTGIITEVENGSYYFNIKKNNPKARRITDKIRSTPIVVFNQEVINLSFQVIFTNRMLNKSSYYLNVTPRIGNLICVNTDSRQGFKSFDPIWVEDNPYMYYNFAVTIEETKNNPYGDESNINISFPPCPIQGLLILEIDISKFFFNNYFAFIGPAIINVQGLGQVNLAYGASVSDIGFDNFKVTKTSPVTNVKTIEDATILVENGNKFSNVPNDFEVVMGDVNTNLRTDGIRTLNYGITGLWARKGVTEAEALNNILCKELLSQYQQNTRIFEGQILGEEITVRNIFNLPLLDLYRFVPISFKYDLGSCIADISMVEVYAEDGLSSGSIGGGSGGSPNVVPLGYVLASKNNIFTDGNDNLFSNGI